MAGCGFDSSVLSGGSGASDGGPGAIDSSPVDGAAGPSPVAHVPEAGRSPGTADLMLGDARIDTTNLEIDGDGPPQGIVFDAWPQEPSGGPELAVLHVRSFTIESGATVQVLGSRPLVIIADGAIVVAGNIDAGARRNQPGPGGSASASGAGAGGNGTHAGFWSDGGGGGGGFGTVGARGGTATCTAPDDCGQIAQGGTPGSNVGNDELTELVGGSGGGQPGAFATGCGGEPPGAGGGAIQLYTIGSLQIPATGAINVGGGGGGRGFACDANWGGASGGGSGGAIYLQAATISVEGTLAANGGGGGGGAGDMNNARNGANGTIGATPALGGNGGGFYGSAGGAGATGDSPAVAGIDDTSGEGNGGGGGGAVGRIVVRAWMGFEAGGTISPPAVQPSN
jgi:hypothetical protein